MGREADMRLEFEAKLENLKTYMTLGREQSLVERPGFGEIEASNVSTHFNLMSILSELQCINQR